MKILYAHNSDISTKSANRVQVLSMCKAFGKIGHSVVLAVPGNSLDIEQFEADIKAEFGIKNDFRIRRIPFLPWGRRLRKFTSFLYLKRILREEAPNIFFTRDILYLSKGLAAGFPSIIELHNNKFHNGSPWLDKYLTRKFMSLTSHKNLRLVIAISEQMRQFWMQRGVDAQKILSLHDGFDAEEFPQVESKRECRTRLGLPHDRIIATYTGNLLPNRGVGQIIELAKRLDQVLFVVVGGPENYRTELEETAKKLGLDNIRFMGQVDHAQISGYLYASDILLAIWTRKVPTINYCSPLKVFEYMAAGRTIVAMGFPTILEVLQNNANALIAIPDDFNDLLGKVVQAIDEDDRIGQQARMDAFSKYSWIRRVEILLEKAGSD